MFCSYVKVMSALEIYYFLHFFVYRPVTVTQCTFKAHHVSEIASSQADISNLSQWLVCHFLFSYSFIYSSVVLLREDWAREMVKHVSVLLIETVFLLESGVKRKVGCVRALWANSTRSYLVMGECGNEKKNRWKCIICY